MYKNAKIVKACTRVYGHIHKIRICLFGTNWYVEIDPNANWFKECGIDSLGNKKSKMPFYELFRVFDIDCEDCGEIEDIEGKYCRLMIDENNCDKIVGLMHIVDDDKFVFLNDFERSK